MADFTTYSARQPYGLNGIAGMSREEPSAGRPQRVDASLRHDVVAYYEHHDPQKLATVDTLMQQFAGRELELRAMLPLLKSQRASPFKLA